MVTAENKKHLFDSDHSMATSCRRATVGTEIGTKNKYKKMGKKYQNFWKKCIGIYDSLILKTIHNQHYGCRPIIAHY